MFDVSKPSGPRMPSPAHEMIPHENAAKPAAAAVAEVHIQESKPLRNTRHEPSGPEVAGGVASLILWALVFAFGVIFPSDVFRAALSDTGTTGPGWMAPLYLVLFLLTYTVSNVAILCCIAGWLGELGRRTRIGGDTHGVVYHRGDYVAAVMRAFLGYLAILTGFVVVGSGINILVTPTPESYVRMAAIISLVGFLAGFNPAMFQSLADKVVGKVIPGDAVDSGKAEVVVHAGVAAAAGKAAVPSNGDDKSSAAPAVAAVAPNVSVNSSSLAP